MCKHNNENKETAKISPKPFLWTIIVSFIALLVLFVVISVVGIFKIGETDFYFLIISCAAVAITAVICLTVLICLTLKCLYKNDEKTDECVKALKETYEKIFNNANKSNRNNETEKQQDNG